MGQMYRSSIEDFLESKEARKYKNKIQLIFTSPPFALNVKKKYGNYQGEEYRTWLANLAPGLGDLLTDDGSIVIELGNAWEKGRPTMSTVVMKALIDFLEVGDLHLCQHLVWHNPAKLPSPAQWVNIEKIRLKDNFTHIWWMSKTQKPKANNKNVLEQYSESMKKLLKNKKYNAGKRPSGHNPNETSFLADNGGSIPGSVLYFPNTRSQGDYEKWCKAKELDMHPARMPTDIAEFFINFLTDEKDLVFDPFAGSNTTGAEAERLGRKWIGVERDLKYIRGSKGRFPGQFK